MKASILRISVFAATLLVAVSTSFASPLSFTLELDSTDNSIDTSEFSQTLKSGSILDVLREDKRFRKVVKALEENRELRDDLENSDRKMTFFAPTDTAWENMEDVVRTIRENRMAREDKEDRRGGRGGRDEDRKDMQDVLTYHMVRDELNAKDLYNGQLIRSQLVESRLGDKHQKIHVHEFFGQFYLNMYARVERREVRANNGVIFAIDNVLCPPIEATGMMTMFPLAFSTTLVAAEKTDLLKRIEESKGLTVFAPGNAAWKSLGIQNLVYLFSPRGCKDLKKIIQYHICEEVLYSTNLMKDKKTTCRTQLRDQEIEINSFERNERRRRRPEGREEREDEPSNWIFTINRGEATIEPHFSDVLAENGVIQRINSVLIPRDVTLPYSVDQMAN